jgi:hypothetical protein
MASACEGLVQNVKDWEDRMVASPKHIVLVLKEMKLKATTDFEIELDCPFWRDGAQAKFSGLSVERSESRNSCTTGFGRLTSPWPWLTMFHSQSLKRT